MLSSVLGSSQAVQVNIAIMRAFVRLRKAIASYKELTLRIDALEERYDGQFNAIFDAIRELISERSVPRKRVIGLGKKS
jgi:hypothetical protein